MKIQKLTTLISFLLLAGTLAYIFSFQSQPVAATPDSANNIITATTYHVAPNGSDHTNCGSTQNPCASIQYAVEKAATGDTIKVAAGTYTYTSASDRCQSWYGTTGVVCVDRKQLSILGGYTASNWHTPNPTANRTIIDGQQNHRGVFVLQTAVAPTSLHMEGFTIRNGRARGIPMRGGSDAINAFGGGMFANSANIILRHIIFENNRAIGENTQSGRGGTGAGGGLAIRSSPYNQLEYITFVDNQARGGTGPERGGYGQGGGLFTFAGITIGSYITATNNLAIGGTTNTSHIASSKPDGLGAGINVQQGSEVTLQYLTVTNNEARGGNAPNTNSGGAFGGGIFAEEASLTILDALIQNNLARGGTGKNQASNPHSRGGGVSSTRASLHIERTEILNNTVQGGNSDYQAGSASGGGISMHRRTGNASFQINNSIIAGNLAAMGSGPQTSSSSGGGLVINGADNVSISHTTIANNSISGGHMQGSGMLLFSHAALTPAIAEINYTIFANHTQDHALHVQAGNQAILKQGLFDNNISNFSNHDNISGLDTMIDGQADFIDVVGHNFRIAHNSAARNAATSSLETIDVDGLPRFQIPDIGASEYQPPRISRFIATPVSSEMILVSWKSEYIDELLDQYVLTIFCPDDSSPPDQMNCDEPTSVGVVNSWQVTGLTLFKTYVFTLQAYDSTGNLLDDKDVSVTPTDIFVYLPSIFSLGIP